MSIWYQGRIKTSIGPWAKGDQCLFRTTGIKHTSIGLTYWVFDGHQRFMQLTVPLVKEHVVAVKRFSDQDLANRKFQPFLTTYEQVRNHPMGKNYKKQESEH